VDHFHAITGVVKDHYHEMLGIPFRKISVVYRGRTGNLFLDQRDQLRERYHREFGLVKGTLLVLHVGRQEYQKGHIILLKAIQKLHEGVISSCAFLFLGREGNTTLEIKAMLANFSPSIKILFLGHRQDVNELMASADVFVFPSLYEGLGGALIEAQAARLPILCSSIKVFEEVIDKDVNALLHNDESELAGNISLLLGDEAKRRKMGENGLLNFRAKFTLGVINKQMLNLYMRFVR
jgi:glycosyltransferase involved in cell wall biosynthesis